MPNYAGAGDKRSSLSVFAKQPFDLSPSFLIRESLP